MSLFDSGIRPVVDKHIQALSEEKREYGDYWSASSAGYCMRRMIFQRLKIPEIKDEIDDARKQRVFSSGHIFHEWIQRITKESGLSLAQEIELQDEKLMVRGHIDDLILIDGKLTLYDYKTQNSRAFTYQKGKPASYFHRLQVGTYMYMLRQRPTNVIRFSDYPDIKLEDLAEARILKISKDDLRMDENQILWDDSLQKEVLAYWVTLNKYWHAKKIPPCTCHIHEGGFLAREKFNPYFYEGKPCSLDYYKLKLKEMNNV